MTITLREITKENYRAACKLKVGPGQEHFVASNAVSIADSKFHPAWQCFGIYADDLMVGFLMHGADDEGQQWIIRLMVDEKQQGHGYGRVAMELILARLRADPACPQVGISYEPQNSVAQKLYASFGFLETGEVEEGETIARLDFKR
jgi:diamine N-acetyltransferase